VQLQNLFSISGSREQVKVHACTSSKRTLYANTRMRISAVGKRGRFRSTPRGQCLPESPRGEQLRTRSDVPVNRALQISRRQATLALASSAQVGRKLRAQCSSLGGVVARYDVTERGRCLLPAPSSLKVIPTPLSWDPAKQSYGPSPSLTPRAKYY
jgi:hypothetical protein